MPHRGRTLIALAMTAAVFACADRSTAQDRYPLIPSVLPAGAEVPDSLPPVGEGDAKAPAPGKAPSDAKNEPAAKAPAVAGWDEMFYLRSADKRFSLRFTGQVQAD